MREYDVASKTDEAFDGFVKKWVYKFEDHESYVEELGANRLINLRVVPGLGYSQFKEDVK